MHLPLRPCSTSTSTEIASEPNLVRPASPSTEAGLGFPPTGDVAVVHTSPEAGDRNPTEVPPRASGEPARPQQRRPPSSPLTAGNLPPVTPPRINPPIDAPPGRPPSPQRAREGASLEGKDTPKSDSPLPLRLRASLQHWSFASPMAQRVIRKGLTWKWVNKPPALSWPPPSTCRGRLTHHISRMLAEGIIAEVPLQRCYPSHLFTVPKTSDTGGERVVIDLSCLNLHINCPTFKMYTVSKLRNSIPKGAHFTSIDLSDAFHHIPIHTRFQKYLAFTHEGKLFFFQAMPFGINIGPRIFSLIATEAVKYLHNLGISASVYIDDWLLWNKSPGALTLQTLTTVNFLQRLGFTLNLKKSLLEPSPTITYLGISWSGTNHTLLPSSKALEKVRAMALEFLQLPSLSLKKYQRLLGSINFVAPYIRYGPLHLRQIILTSPNFKVRNSQPPSQLFLHHLRWWTQTQNLVAPVPMSIPPPNLTIWTDASKTGWGGGIFSGIHCQRRLVPRGEPPPHKHPGMSSRDSFPPLTKSPTGIRSSDKDRQHRCSVSYKQTGVQQEQNLISLSPRPSSTVRSEQLDNPIEASTRAPQHMGRLSISKSPSEGGVVSISTELPDAEDSPKSGDRSLRPPRKRPTADLRVSIPVPLSHSGRRPSRELEQVEENLPLPPSRSDSGLPPKTSRIQRLRAGHRPSAPFRSLVARVPSRLHPNRRRPRRWAMGARRMAESHRENLLSLSRFQFLQNLYSRKYEAPVALALSNAHRGSTRGQYEHCWKDFQRWLSSNPSKTITKGSVLLYLTELAQTRGLSPKTVLVYRNALKLPLLHGFNINTSDREFSLLARSQFLQNPPPKKLIPAWNPNKVLSMLEQPEFLNHRATPHRLLMKTLFLVALATGNRVSEIAAFTRVGSKILPGSKKAIIAVRPGFLYKNQTLDRSPPNIVIKALLDQNLSPNRLCPVDSLRCWLALSDTWGVDAIFVNPKSHKKMNRGAVSQLLVTTINRSQPGVLAKAHDIRKVSATFAWARGVPPHQIIQTMFWKSTSVFIDKYLVPLQTNQ